MKLLSWNVNGLRAALQKGLLDWMRSENADAFCLQETKCHPADVFGTQWPAGYSDFFNPAARPGYSGTALLTRHPPLSVSRGIGLPDLDAEGRALTAEFPDFFLVNTYVPNAQPGLARIETRAKWDAALLAHLLRLEKTKPVLCCGDLNVAHEELDLARPKQNIGEPGFSDRERDGFRAFLAAGFLDTFREFEKGGGHYSWWSYRGGARARNVGWRIDYFLASKTHRPR
ncbi:MAG: exodeoxyribonuclease III, partial [Opitutaceae bacterium]|nr:exodeoxyribonuclease III [Opitutaceae bacterium]